MMPQPLTERQKQVFDYIFEFTRSRGYQPSLREVAAHFGGSSPATAVCHLNVLAKRGWIGTTQRPGKGSTRCIVFLRRPDGSPFEGFQ